MTSTDVNRVLVIKFGGTSLATPARVRLAARRIAALQQTGRDIVVVVSASGSTTDHLVKRVAAVTQCSPPVTREYDRLLATGEDRSAAFLALALDAIQVAARSLRGGEAGIRADGHFGSGVPHESVDDTVLKLLRRGIVPVVAGFQAYRVDGETVTLGRGGSDTSAVVLAAALGAPCHIVTDVDAVYDTDPRRSPNARRFKAISWQELCRLTQNGAVVVHPLAAYRAAKGEVPLRIYHYRARSLLSAGTAIGALPSVHFARAS